MKPTKNIIWLQDCILGAAFLIKQLDVSNESIGFQTQIKQFLSDASKIEQAIIARTSIQSIQAEKQHHGD